MPLVIKNGTVVLKARPPVLGKHFTNREIKFFDGRDGCYWEANPVVECPHEKRVQKALLIKPKQVKVKVRYKFSDEITTHVEITQ